MTFIFLVVYTDNKLDECVSRIKKISSELFPDEDLCLIVADTSGQREFVVKDDVMYVYPGNMTREFGGWQACHNYAFENTSPMPSDKVIIANDTFYSNYGDAYLEGFASQTYDILDTKKAIYGYMDCFPASVEIDGESFSSWIRTSFFVTNIRTLMDVNLFRFPYKKTDIFSNDDAFLLPNKLLSENYMKYLCCWLFENVEGDEEFNVKWHSAQPLTSDNMAFMQEKTMCILSEHYLTWGARMNGVEIIKINE